MAEEKNKKPAKIKSVLSRIKGGGSHEADSGAPCAGAVREFMELPVDLSLDPLSSGREMTKFLEDRLAISSESLALISSALSPLLLESNSIPAKLIRKGTDHDGACPVTTGIPLALRSVEPGVLCRVCNPDSRLGEAILRLPLTLDGRVMGVLSMTFSAWPELLDDEDFFGAFCRRADLDFKVKILAETNRLLQISDDLTHVYNYRYFMRSLDAELERSRRYDHPFTLLIADIEKFQAFNRRYGYDAGDAMLREVARCLKTSLRVTDIIARYSGQQFAMILTETDRKGGEVVMGKMRESVAKMRVRLPAGNEEVGVTVNLGIGAFPRDATVPARLIACVEDSLLHAKTGR